MHQSFKIAVLISGQMRTFERCLDNLNANLLGPGVDTFVHTTPDPGTSQILERHQFSAVRVEDDPDFRDYRMYRGREEHYQFDNWAYRIVTQLYKNRRVWEFVEGKNYDWIVRLRADTILTEPIDFFDRLKPATLYIPAGDSHYGLNDRFGIGDYDVMRAYMGRYDDLEAYLGMGGVLHSEENLKYTMIRHDFRVVQERLHAIIRRADHDQDVVINNYDRWLWWFRNKPHVRDKGNWTKKYESRRGRYVGEKI